MASAFVPDHEIIVVTKDMAELPQQCYDVRVAVFISEQGFPIDTEFDERGKDSTHLLVRLVPSLKPVGIILAVCTPSHYELSRLAVLKEYRRFSFGRALVLRFHDWVRTHAITNGQIGQVRIQSHSQLQVKGFYAKYGYIPEGDEFDEDGVPHQPMVATIKLD